MPTARAVTFVGPGRVEIRPVEVDPAEGQVVVRTAWSGISGGSEALAFRGQVDPDLPLDQTLGALAGTFRFPFRYGYSCVGTVERGTGDVPEGATVFAFHPHQDLFGVDPSELVAVDGVDPRLATLFPLVETALQITLDAGAVGGEVVAVFGLGSVGLLTALVLERHGASVIAVEPSEGRRSIAVGLGLRTAPPGEASGLVEEATGGRGVPVAIEASGSPAAPASALPLLAHEGTLLVASWYGTKEVPLPLGAEFHRRRLTIRSTQVSSIPAALEWTVARRRRVARDLLDALPLKVLATHAFPFEDAQAAFRAVEAPADGLIHAALRYV